MQTPDRPQGVERNIVVTLWDWSRPTAYLHDLIGTDERKPTVNSWGALYGAMELSTDWVPILDPVLYMATETKMPVKFASHVKRSSQPKSHVEIGSRHDRDCAFDHHGGHRCGPGIRHILRIGRGPSRWAPP